MSLPPEMLGLVSDFLAALTGLLYVLGGLYVGKWLSEKSEFVASLEFDRAIKQLRREPPEKPPKGTLDTWSKEDIKNCASWLVEIAETLGREHRRVLLAKSAQRSKWIGITCIVVGFVLFLVRFMI